MILKSCEKKEKNLAEIIVTISAEEFESALNEAYKKNRNQISVPGFRQGKAPRKIIEGMYGASVFHNDALDIILPTAYAFCVKESDLRIVGFPNVTDADIKKDEGTDVTFEVALYPEVTVGEYKGLSAVRPSDEVPESAVDDEISGVRLKGARIETVSRPAVTGDTAVIDYEGFLDGEPFDGGKGENYELELGSGTFIPGFEEKIQGMSAGEERDIDLVFPENYAEHLAGKPVVFKVKLNEVKEKLLPELDDEFAKDVSEFDTLEEYKNSIRERLQKAKIDHADEMFETALVDKVAETIDCDIPDAMLEEHMNNSMNSFVSQLESYGMDPAMYLQMMNTTPEAFRENMRATSEKQIKTMLALEKIAELEGIEATDEDIEAHLQETAERYGTPIEYVKEQISREAAMHDVKLRNAAKLIRANATAEAPPAEEEDAPEEKGEEKPKAKRATKKAEPKDTGDGADAPAAEEKKPAAKSAAAKKKAEQSADEEKTDGE